MVGDFFPNLDCCRGPRCEAGEGSVGEVVALVGNLRLPSGGEHLGGEVVLTPPLLPCLDVEPLGRRRSTPTESELVDRHADVYFAAERLGECLAEVRLDEAFIGPPQTIDFRALGWRVGAGIGLDVFRFEFEFRHVLVHGDHANERLPAQDAVRRRGLGEGVIGLLFSL